MALRIGIIGCGGMAQAHLQAFKTRPGFSLIAAADIELSRAQQACADFEIPHAFADYKEMLQMELEAVSICLPHHLHAEAAIAALQAGKHVLCEKPMATSLAETDAMIAAAQAAQRILMIGQILRFRPVNQKAREIISGGGIGEIKQIIRRRFSYSKEYPRAPWSADPEKAGGWLLYGFGSHEADTILYLTDSEATTVYACGEKNNPHWGDYDEIAFLFGLSCGGFATELHTLNCPWGAWDCLIIGTQGALNIYSDKLSHNDTEYSLPLPPDGGMSAQIDEFGAAIREEREPIASGRDVRKTMALLEAAKISLQTGQIVDAQAL